MRTTRMGLILLGIFLLFTAVFAALYKDPIDEKIKADLKLKAKQTKDKIVIGNKDKEYVRKGVVDDRVLQLANYLVGTKKHRLVLRIKDGYDDEKHAFSRESEYPKGAMPNVSAHFDAQAFDIFIADGVETAWQVSTDKSKQKKAQAKIRQILRETFDYSYKHKNYMPTQILIYRPEDVNYFAKDVYALYGRTEAERGLSGLLYGPRHWDRIHIGF